MTVDQERLIFLSLKPRFADAIVQGSKSIELRRRPPRIEVPTRALLYASSPRMALVGECTIREIVELAPSTMWRRHGPDTGVTRKEFMKYFSGCDRAYGLHVDEVLVLRPVSLNQLRESIEGFEPPQSFRYLTTEQYGSIS